MNKLGTKNRPDAVSWWIQRARKLEKVPTTVKLDSFPGQVRVWWKAIQPAWRVDKEVEWPLLRTIPEDETWDSTWHGGANGMFLLLMCLYWLRFEAKEKLHDAALNAFALLAEDVAFAFGSMLQARKSATPCPTLEQSLATAISSQSTPSSEQPLSSTSPLRSATLNK